MTEDISSDSNSDRKPNTWLSAYARNVTSQGVEDGIIEKVLDVIGECDKWCVEFGSWDGDPDIDAICRMEHAPDCRFDANVFPMSSNKISPFNSQNTFVTRLLLRDYFLFPHVGRMDDIWAGYYVQAKGYRVVYCKPSVCQARNEHDLTKDMKQEYLGYENNLSHIKDLGVSAEKMFDYLPERSALAFKHYRSHFENL